MFSHDKQGSKQKKTEFLACKKAERGRGKDRRKEGREGGGEGGKK